MLSFEVIGNHPALRECRKLLDHPWQRILDQIIDVLEEIRSIKIDFFQLKITKCELDDGAHFLYFLIKRAFYESESGSFEL